MYAGLAHAADWGITLVSALGIAGASRVVTDEPPVDGLDLWPALTTRAPSPRSEILLSMRDADQCGEAFTDCTFRGQLAFRQGRYKLLYGHTGLRGAQGDSCTWSSASGMGTSVSSNPAHDHRGSGTGGGLGEEYGRTRGQELNCWNGWGRPRDVGSPKPPVPLPPEAGQPPNSSVYDW